MRFRRVTTRFDRRLVAPRLGRGATRRLVQPEPGGDPMPKPTFAHHRLEAYRAALDLAEAGHRLAGRIPRGYRWLADHLARAACAAPVLTAEGANRVSPGTKHQRFSEALGEMRRSGRGGRGRRAPGAGPRRGARRRPRPRRPHRGTADRAGEEVRLSETVVPAIRPVRRTPRHPHAHAHSHPHPNTNPTSDSDPPLTPTPTALGNAGKSVRG
jgi:hypothetical protein